VDRGVVLTRLGRSEEALAAYREVLERDPRSEAALFNTGLLLSQLGRLAEAQGVLGNLVRSYPRHGETEWIRRVLAARPPQP
jgi:tetratricopeptide (TPR) repeat protein